MHKDKTVEEFLAGINTMHQKFDKIMQDWVCNEYLQGNISFELFATYTFDYGITAKMLEDYRNSHGIERI